MARNTRRGKHYQMEAWEEAGQTEQVRKENVAWMRGTFWMPEDDQASSKNRTL
ncbi:hypothetical protein HanRHA438_Chr17g0806501 [Helianthus annuus]|nr:hypothetical protein HanRHA438_Chr17g0806501 [Helianthus annuus]